MSLELSGQLTEKLENTEFVPQNWVIENELRVDQGQHGNSGIAGCGGSGGARLPIPQGDSHARIDGM